MSRGSFNSLNKQVEVFTFQTYSSSAQTFSPSLSLSNNDRVLWSLGDGSPYIAGNSISYVYSDTGITKTVKVLTPKLTRIDGLLNLVNQRIRGNLDISNLKGFSLNGNSNFFIGSNPQMTGITQPNTTINIRQFSFGNCDINGHLNLSNVVIGGTVLPGFFQGNNNTKLTGVTHAYSNLDVTTYQLSGCDLRGTHDLSMFTNLGGNFNLSVNPNLTKIIHTASTKNFNDYDLMSSNITGNHDLSMFPNLGGSFRVSLNVNLTGITHTVSTRVFSAYSIFSCNIKGNHDLSMFPNLGGSLLFNSNASLTGITHTASTVNITDYNAVSCDLRGTLDLSMLNLGVTGSTRGWVNLLANPNLTNVLFPTVSNIFRNNENSSSNYAFVLKNCNLDYIDFKPLSGSTLVSGTTIGLPAIELQDNTMGAGDVNHILDDFKNMATNNPSGWSNIRLFIGGTNTDPDSSSGGYDGLAAIATLTGSPYNWTITY